MGSNLFVNILIVFGVMMVFDSVVLMIILAKFGRGVLAKIVIWIIILTTLIALITFSIGAVGVNVWTLGVGVTASIPVAFWILYSIQQTIVKPLQQLTKVSQAMALGDLSAVISFQSRDEVGKLAEAMREMISYQRGIAQLAEVVADNDLRVNVAPKSEKDELGLAFAKMVANLKMMIEQVAENAVNLNSASGQLALASTQAGQATSQISATIQQVAAGISTQTDSVTRTAASVEKMGHAIDTVTRGAGEQAEAVERASSITAQISAAIQQVAANAQNSASGANQAAGTARSGAQTVGDTIQGMQTIKQKVGVSAHKVQEMGKRSDEIGAIVETIDDIASQTNLLALNAAIEAARAGEHGKGFAVVADEVRKLAERSSLATKEIGKLIRGIQQNMAEAVTSIDEVTQEVEHGVRRAVQSEEALNTILKAVEAVTHQVEQIAAASQHISASAGELVAAVDSVSTVVQENTSATQQMSANSNTVMQAVENIASVSEENSASVEEVSASTEEMTTQVEEVSASARTLSEMANNLTELVARFMLETTPVSPRIQRYTAAAGSSSQPNRADRRPPQPGGNGARNAKGGTFSGSGKAR